MYTRSLMFDHIFFFVVVKIVEHCTLLLLLLVRQGIRWVHMRKSWFTRMRCGQNRYKIMITPDTRGRLTRNARDYTIWDVYAYFWNLPCPLVGPVKACAPFVVCRRLSSTAVFTSACVTETPDIYQTRTKIISYHRDTSMFECLNVFRVFTVYTAV